MCSFSASDWLVAFSFYGCQTSRGELLWYHVWVKKYFGGQGDKSQSDYISDFMMAIYSWLLPTVTLTTLLHSDPSLSNLPPHLASVAPSTQITAQRGIGINSMGKASYPQSRAEGMSGKSELTSAGVEPYNALIDDSKTCSDIIPHCQICHIDEGLCVQCQQGYLFDQNRCKACADYDPNCLNCTYGPTLTPECTHCANLYYLFTNNTCRLCSHAIPNCGNCTLASLSTPPVCTSCLYHTVLYKSHCHSCTLLIPNCTLCEVDIDYLYCAKCGSGYLVAEDQQSCLPCSGQVQHCRECEWAGGTGEKSVGCSVCMQGYRLDGGECVAQKQTYIIVLSVIGGAVVLVVFFFVIFFCFHKKKSRSSQPLVEKEDENSEDRTVQQRLNSSPSHSQVGVQESYLSHPNSDSSRYGSLSGISGPSASLKLNQKQQSERFKPPQSPVQLPPQLPKKQSFMAQRESLFQGKNRGRK